MAFKPNTTIYLCTGTGLDYNHSAWMHRYAYSDDSIKDAKGWWNTLFQWFKCHSIAEGFWYYTYTDPSKGFIRIGRTPLSNGSDGQKGLGNANKQTELDSDSIPYAEAIRAVDYVVFANDEGDVQYCFVDSINYINFNTAQINFTVDAILTYQKYFNLGRCFVDRDMQFDEWEVTTGDRKNQIPTFKNINVQPDYTDTNESNMIFQKLSEDDEYNAESLSKLTFGAYSEMFCMTDVDLENITPSDNANVLPDFKPADSTKMNIAELGIGIYRIKNRVNKAFEDLGSFNAMEHILASYVLPANVLEPATKDIEFVKDAYAIIKPEYRLGYEYKVKLPSFFSDTGTIQLNQQEIGFKPINFKCLTAPYCYVSITDKQGNSVELIPQQFYDREDMSDISFYHLDCNVDIVAAPNVPSYLYIRNDRSNKASKENPFMSLWQASTYAMTPNNSGYRATQLQGQYQAESALFTMAILGTIGVGLLLATGGAALPAVLAGESMAGAIGMGVAKSAISAGTGGLSAYLNTSKQAEYEEKYGLPKAIGSGIQGLTVHNMISTGYEFYWCHTRTDVMKLIDYMFSIIGYKQNAFRYPHINTRKRWCYVKLATVNIFPIGANNYEKGGVPFWARAQIEERLKNGVTFWNLRHAIGEYPVADYTAIPPASLFSKYVRNYGNSIRSEEMLDNADHDDGYASTFDEEAKNME